MNAIKTNLANCVTGIGIIGWITACIITKNSLSWSISEWLFLISLVTDALDGTVARKFGSTKAGPYLDDIADMINFGIHPALWIWIISGQWWLALFFAFCILARLIRFTILKQSSDIFSGLPSPAAALTIFGLIFIVPEKAILIIGTLFISFLTVSQIRFLHVIKYQQLSSLRFPLLMVIAMLPFLFWYNQIGIGITHITIIGIYMLFSLLLLPQYARR